MTRLLADLNQDRAVEFVPVSSFFVARLIGLFLQTVIAGGSSSLVFGCVWRTWSHAFIHLISVRRSGPCVMDPALKMEIFILFNSHSLFNVPLLLVWTETDLQVAGLCVISNLNIKGFLHSEARLWQGLLESTGDMMIHWKLFMLSLPWSKICQWF